MPVQEASDRAQFPLQRLGPQLAQGMAQVGLGCALGYPRADAPGEPVRQAQGGRGERLGDLVAIGAFGGQVGAHEAGVGVTHPEVDVEEQRSDAVIELTGDAQALVGEMPAGLVRRRERVVRAREDDFVEAASTQSRCPLAAADAAARLTALRLALAPAPEQICRQPGGSESQEESRGPASPLARAPGCSTEGSHGLWEGSHGRWRLCDDEAV